ncbi:hypothetical protein CROQUDRAFT_673981 [Cronartium quercuum f. sp. fusiforme G11]|uniref:G-patch domain-containing protein n=1 Tax=Cronartium quercuum f. sp. fusiforme G11 TaxID=708437 RepID=A0A9P6T756_9BASI|nr:hypothetical protein CROQUDRAFT_673981 [Cronartium quercuum f. sp. fusiforme G11]
MGKKRNALMDESDLDSSPNDSSDEETFQDRDLEAENELFRDPYQSKKSKKRRKNGKVDALYGIFGNDDDEIYNRPAKVDKSLHKAQIFVPSTSKNSLEIGTSKGGDQDEKSENQSINDDSTSSSGDSYTSDSDNEENETAAQHDDGVEIDVQEDQSQQNFAPGPQANNGRHGLGARSGLGSTSNSNLSASNNDFRAMLGSGSMANSFQRAGLGSKDLGSDLSTSIPDQANDVQAVNDDLSSLPRRSFLGARASEPTQPVVPKKPLSRAEQQHFAKLASSKQSSMGLKMLEKMGWKSGTGLGAKGEGIVTPLESKVRPKGMGLSYEGFEERTKQAKEEDRRNGKIIEDEDDSNSKKNDRSKKGTKLVREAWKAKAKSTKKSKVVHRTYEEIINELADESGNAGLDAGLGEIIDLTGRKLPSLSTTLLHHSRGPTEESKEQRLPELMHNLNLICDMAKGNLINLAKEGTAIKRKQEQLVRDKAKSTEIMKIKEQKLKNMKKIMTISSKTKATYLNILNVIQEDTKSDEICGMLEQFDESFNELLEFFQDDKRAEYDALNLDEIVVCALAPILRRAWRDWDVLLYPHLSVAELKRFKKCFRLEDSTTNSTAHYNDEMYSNQLHRDHEKPMGHTNESRKMTAYESLIWNDWVPKIRSTVNTWSPSDSEPMIELYVKWKPLLPQFVRDNLLDQLIVPKLLSSIASWDFRERQPISAETDERHSCWFPLHLFIFPWLEHIGSYRGDLLLQEVKLKLATWLKAWKFIGSESGEKEKIMIQDLLVWKQDVFKRRDWDKLVLKNLIPNLAGYLKSQLIINPKQQDLKPFQLLLRWSVVITHQDILNQLYSEFFVKWLETLWIWLVAGTGNSDQIGQWYNWWKSVFPEHLNTQVPAIQLGFARGLELMNQARSLSSLGFDLRSKLERPDLSTRPLIEVSQPNTQRHSSSNKKSRTNVSRQAGFEEVTFKSIVEEEATKLNLFLIPLGKSLESNGMSLYRVSRQYQSKHKNSGLIIYIEDDVVFVKSNSEDGKGGIEWEPMAVDEMLTKASGLSSYD